jgi:hypothetical protein
MGHAPGGFLGVIALLFLKKAAKVRTSAKKKRCILDTYFQIKH